MKRVTFAALVFLGIAATASLAAAQAAAPTITIVSPDPGITIASDTMDVMVAYEAPKGALVARVELVVDGAVAQSVPLDPPERSGALSLTWEAASCLEGEHLLAVRAVDTGGRVGKSQIAVSLHRGLPDMESRPRITRPAPGTTVAGVTSFEVESAAAQVKYVIFLVDNVFKAMSNIRPFSYNWDTTHYLNGIHQLQAKAYLADGTEALSQAIEVQVDNPSGMTAMRPAAPARPRPEAAPARTPEPSLPPAIHTESPTPYSKSMEVADAEFGPPGTAPYVSETGDVVQPPTSLAAARAETAPRLEVAGLPQAAAQTPGAPQAAPTSVLAPPRPADRPVTVPAEATVAAPADAIRAPAEADAVTVAPVAPVALPSLAVSFGLARSTPAPAQVSAPVVKRPEAAPSEPTASPQQIAVLPPQVAEPAKSAAAPAEISAPAVNHPEAPTSEPAASPQQIAMLPPRVAEPEQRPQLAAKPSATTTTYVVQNGDSLWSIAARHGVTVAQLARANGLTESSAVRPGEQLCIATPSIYVNGEPLTSDVPVFVTDGRMLAPFRAVVEQAGGSVTWEPKTQQAKADARGKEIAVTVGSDVATVDGKLTPMGSATVMRGNRALVPLRFLGQALDMVLHYRGGVVRVAEGE